MPDRKEERRQYLGKKSTIYLNDCYFKLFAAAASLFRWASACDLKFITKQLKTKIYILTL